MPFGLWQLHVTLKELLAPDGTMAPLSNAGFGLPWAFLEHRRRMLSRDQALDEAREDRALRRGAVVHLWFLA